MTVKFTAFAAPEVAISRNSLLFSLLAGNRGAETGSTLTASATTQSPTTRDFPMALEIGLNIGLISIPEAR
jgi:hypothetical protein